MTWRGHPSGTHLLQAWRSKSRSCAFSWVFSSDSGRWYPAYSALAAAEPSPLEQEVESRSADEDHDGPARVVVVDVHLRHGRGGVVAAPVHAPGPAHVCARDLLGHEGQRVAHATSPAVRQQGEGGLAHQEPLKGTVAGLARHFFSLSRRWPK